MNRQEWYTLYQEIRTPAHGPNLFPTPDRAEIGLLIALEERREKLRQAKEAKNGRAGN
jgi:hypothetical protein